MTQHRSIYGAKVKTPDELCKRLLTAINKGAQVISIRIYRNNTTPQSEVKK